MKWGKISIIVLCIVVLTFLCAYSTHNLTPENIGLPVQAVEALTHH